jgi:uncharacterized protein (DUF4415 family)
MANDNMRKAFVPGRGYSREDWDVVSDNPRVTRKAIEKSKPLKEALPEVHDAIQKSRGRPRSDDPKRPVTVRLERSVLEQWQRDPDWRAKMAEVLRRSV